MNDYNLYYYWLEIPTDATQEEIDAAYVKKRDEYALLVKKYGTPNTLCGDPKWAEFLQRVESAYEVLGDPAKRQQYHNQTYPSCDHADKRRSTLIRCAEFGDINCWPPRYRPSRPGPTPTSYDSRSGCAMLLCAFLFLTAYWCW